MHTSLLPYILTSKCSLCNEYLIMVKASGFGTSSILDPHQHFFLISCCCLQSWRSYSYGFTYSRRPQWGRCWSVITLSCICVWVAAELVSSGQRDHPFQVRGRASSSRSMVKVRMSPPKYGVQLSDQGKNIRGGDSFLLPGSSGFIISAPRMSRV